MDQDYSIPQGMDAGAVTLARAIRHQESGGDYNSIGDGGKSSGAYQWNNGEIPLQSGGIPKNFQSDAQTYGLDPNDFSPKNQDMVAYNKIKALKDSGLNVPQIAAIWNGGDEKRMDPNYITPSGLPSQKEGVYDVPKYAMNVNDLYQSYKEKANPTTDQTNTIQPTDQSQPGYFRRIINDVKSLPGELRTTAQNSADEYNQGIQLENNSAPFSAGRLKGAGKELLGIGEAGVGSAWDVLKTIFSPVSEAISPVIQGAVNKISDIPSVQQSAMTGANSKILELKDKADDIAAKHPEVAQLFSDTYNLATTLAGAEKGAESSSEVLDKVKSNPTINKMVNNLKSKFSNIDDETKFNKYSDNAFKPGTKEAGMGDAWHENVRNIANYIVNAKDDLGIVDENGNIKKPSQYNMTDNLEALNRVKPQIYKAYSDVLEGADMDKFKSSISDKTTSLIQELNDQKGKIISLPVKNVISTMIKELSSDSMKDASPMDLQNHIQDLGRRAFSGNMSEGKAIIANTASKLKTILDDSLDEIDGKQYRDLKTTYHSAKVVESSWARAAAKELRDTPGLGDKLAGYGMTFEGIQFLLTHDPMSIVKGLSVKGAAKFIKWLNSPTRSLSKMYKIIEDEQTRGTPQ